jgi:hypothetical protein
MIRAGLSRREYIAYVYRNLDLLTDSQRAHICNGVGSGAWGWRWFRPSARIRKLFYKASKFHDLAYHYGGSDEYRAWADAEFFGLMLEAAYTEGGWSRARARVGAWVCINAVRVFGGFSWNKK